MGRLAALGPRGAQRRVLAQHRLVAEPDLPAGRYRRASLLCHGLLFAAYSGSDEPSALRHVLDACLGLASTLERHGRDVPVVVEGQNIGTVLALDAPTLGAMIGRSANLTALSSKVAAVRRMRDRA